MATGEDFVHLHLHTEYSLLDGANRTAELFATAKSYGMSAIGLTDHGNMFGALEFYRQGKETGIKPILGCELYVAPGSRFDRSSTHGISDASYHLTVIAKNYAGYRNLIKLVTAGYLEGFYYRPRVDKELLAKHAEGLIILSGCLSGEVLNALANGQEERAREAARWYQEHFGAGHYFLEVQRHDLDGEGAFNEALMRLSRDLHIPLVATNDCHYLQAADAEAHEVLLCIQTGKSLSDPKRFAFSTPDFYFKSAPEMATRFHDIPGAVEQTLAIAESCNLEIPLGETHLPRYQVPSGYTLDSYLEATVFERLQQRLNLAERRGRRLPPELSGRYEQRAAHELHVIQQMGYSGYFLIVWDFIDYAKRQGIPVGPGRGSAAGSLVAYALGITELDPLQYNLLFERFLNPERVTLPDIDIDFCQERRDEVIEYVTQKYGKENVAQIITFGTMMAKAVLRDVGRTLDIPYGEVDRIAKLVPNRLNITLADALKEEPKLREIDQQGGQMTRLISTAQALEGLVRHASTHAAGVVIAPEPLTEYLPLYKGNKGEVVTQYAMEDIEQLGLLKMDFLGLRTLTVLHNTLRFIQDSRRTEITLGEIPLDDARTYQLLSEARTFGVFQLESQGLRDILRKLKPSVFEDVIALVALYRPGPLGSGMIDDFIQRKHGKAEVEYLLPELEPILKETYGIIVYQEQVMQIASAIAGFSLGTADILRRAMGKKKPEVMAEQREVFLKGALEHGFDQKKAEELFELMAYFAGYGFNKSHSAAYALIAYWTAYLKAHHPREYMAALLTSEVQNTDKVIRYINESRDMGISILSPDVNDSYRDFRVVGEAIRFGLAAVKNVGDHAIEAIILAREADGPFTSLYDFCQRVNLKVMNRRVIESLIKCGAFDTTGDTRAQMIACLDDYLEAGQKRQRDREDGQISMFDDGEDASPTRHRPRVPSLPEWEESQLLAHEKEVIGFYITGHPLTRYERQLRLYAIANTQTLGTFQDGDKVSLGGMVFKTRLQTTRKGDRMAFVTLEDVQGQVDVIVFPEVYKEFGTALEADQPVLVRGIIDWGEDNPKIIADRIVPLAEAALRLSPQVHISLQTLGLNRDILGQLKSILQRAPGASPVYLHLLFPDQREVVLLSEERLQVAPSEALVQDIETLFGHEVVHFE
ncbi:MAG TPA: DNA polymerase III subunit alpha [Candidatus Tectomicrobia bacterium]|nr:DNA polymerase III subunit alpha [Candidatus Tectomicrobia bacterium]